MNDLFFELVGPDYPLAKAEVLSTIEGLSHGYDIHDSEPGILSLRTDCPVEPLTQRLGLIHRVYERINSLSVWDASQIDADLPSGSVGVRTERIKREDIDTLRIKKELGDVIAKTNPIDLDSPEHEIYVVISKNHHVGRKIYEIDKKELRAREVKNRPFSSPISLKPRYTRALINLSRADKNSKVHDPFCGTGGVLIEASKMGLSVSGGDIDPDMIEGCKKNLRDFNVEAPLETGDVSDTIPSGIDAIITDPPYGRASSTSKEELSSIYERLFEASKRDLKEGGYLSAIFPEKKYISTGKRYLRLVETYEVRVHRSLKRHFTVFKKERT